MIYAIGDIHGRYDLLKDLLSQIIDERASLAPERRPLIVFCGDYIDRGPESAKVVEALAWLKRRRDFEVRLLKGNHEQVLLDFLESPRLFHQWVGIGGRETLASYGVSLPSRDLGPDSWSGVRDQLLGQMPSAHLHLLQNLELILIVGRYAFVHAGVRPKRPLERQSERDLLWIREEFTKYEGPLPKIVVHGHAWSGKDPVVEPYRMGIDTGAYATGVLTAVRLEGDHARFLQTGARPNASLERIDHSRSC